MRKLEFVKIDICTNRWYASFPIVRCMLSILFGDQIILPRGFFHKIICLYNQYLHKSISSIYSGGFGAISMGSSST